MGAGNESSLFASVSILVVDIVQFIQLFCCKFEKLKLEVTENIITPFFIQYDIRTIEESLDKIKVP